MNTHRHTPYEFETTTPLNCSGTVEYVGTVLNMTVVEPEAGASYPPGAYRVVDDELFKLVDGFGPLGEKR
ncbi:MAG: hypothetical protein DRJ03_06960 [Chloroflexi bacterium]|nr:MAG: hypothetical protein DRJ03_06960 [Chloroflexota bacterium]